jgi:hypothetical protein
MARLTPTNAKRMSAGLLTSGAATDLNGIAAISFLAQVRGAPFPTAKELQAVVESRCAQFAETGGPRRTVNTETTQIACADQMAAEVFTND